MTGDLKESSFSSFAPLGLTDDSGNIPRMLHYDSVTLYIYIYITSFIP